MNVGETAERVEGFFDYWFRKFRLTLMTAVILYYAGWILLLMTTFTGLPHDWLDEYPNRWSIAGITLTSILWGTQAFLYVRGPLKIKDGWYEHFAWIPVLLSDGGWAWLKTIYVKHLENNEENSLVCPGPKSMFLEKSYLFRTTTPPSLFILQGAR